MCNAYRLRKGPAELGELFGAAGLPLLFPDGRVPNIPPHEFTRPTNMLPILRPLDPAAPRELELVEARWGLIPFFHKGAVKDWKFLCTNARSETVATTGTYREPYRRRRCLVPAGGFYEWTGEKGAKTRWLFERTDGAMWCFPGVWDRWEGPDGAVETFALLTSAPGPDVAPYHDRQPVILGPEGWAGWLDPSADPAAGFRGSPEGELRAARA